MPRGDTVTIKYSGPSGTETEVVTARAIGAKVDILEPRSADPYLIVKEVNKGGAEVQVARFAKGAVLSVVTGKVGPAKRGKAK